MCMYIVYGENISDYAYGHTNTHMARGLHLNLSFRVMNVFTTVQNLWAGKVNRFPVGNAAFQNLLGSTTA